MRSNFPFIEGRLPWLGREKPEGMGGPKGQLSFPGPGRGLPLEVLHNKKSIPWEPNIKAH